MASSPGTSPGTVLPDDLLAALATLVAQRAPGHPLLVSSDFDGVLAPLVDDPSASAPTAAAAAALARLGAVPDDQAVLALVSGRDLETLAALSSAPAGAVLVGSHGAEQGTVSYTGTGTGTTVERHPFALTDEEQHTLDAVRDGLQSVAAGTAGAWVEEKPSAAVLHTRQSDPAEGAVAGDAARALGSSLGAHTMTGKDVVEIAVVDTSKGVALVRLRDELAATGVVYLGDDVTDETAFEALSAEDVTVKVGPGATAARFRVDSVDGAAQVLTEIADLLS